MGEELWFGRSKNRHGKYHGDDECDNETSSEFHVNSLIPAFLQIDSLIKIMDNVIPF